MLSFSLSSQNKSSYSAPLLFNSGQACRNDYVDKCRCNVDIAFLPGPPDAEDSWSVVEAAGDDIVAADDILATDDGFAVK